MGRETWVKRVERLKDSGLTTKEFAAEIGVNANTLAHRRWRLAAEARPRQDGRAYRRVAPKFVEVAPAQAMIAAAGSAQAAKEPLEVIVGDELRVRVPPEFDATTLRRLVAALRA